MQSAFSEGDEDSKSFINGVHCSRGKWGSRVEGKLHELGRLRGQGLRDELADHASLAAYGGRGHRDELVDHASLAACGKQGHHDGLVLHDRLAGCGEQVLRGIRNQLAALF